MHKYLYKLHIKYYDVMINEVWTGRLITELSSCILGYMKYKMSAIYLLCCQRDVQFYWNKYRCIFLKFPRLLIKQISTKMWRCIIFKICFNLQQSYFGIPNFQNKVIKNVICLLYFRHYTKIKKSLLKWTK